MNTLRELQDNMSSFGLYYGGPGIEESTCDDELDDVWCEDGIINDEYRELHTIGYREGIAAGKETSAQEGFNVGFKQSASVGYNFGIVRGISSTLASLPDQLKEKLAGTLENKDRLQSLYERVQKISTNDVLKIFFNSINQTETKQSHEHLEGNSHATITTCEDSNCKSLDILLKELITYIKDFPEIKVNIESQQ